MACPYATLGLQRGAGTDEIKRAYKALVVEHHPDKHVAAGEAQQAAASARFKDIQEAYQLLSDDRKRSAYEASRAAGRSTYGYAGGVNTDWSTHGGASYQAQSGYTSRLSRWEYLRRAAKQGMRSFDQPLHVGLALLLVGGVVLFDAVSNVAWEARNKGRRFEDIVARKQQQKLAGAAAASAAETAGGAQDDGGGGDGDGGGSGGAAAEEGGSGKLLRSAWLDSMRGRDVNRQPAQRQPGPASRDEGREGPPRDVDRAVIMRASPPGQMAGHRA